MINRKVEVLRIEMEKRSEDFGQPFECPFFDYFKNITAENKPYFQLCVAIRTAREELATQRTKLSTEDYATKLKQQEGAENSVIVMYNNIAGEISAACMQYSKPIWDRIDKKTWPYGPAASTTR